MEKLELNLENCYGIKKLNESIEFKKMNNKTGIKESINACLIYASNGTMKTSFANTFLDIENDRDTIDRIVLSLLASFIICFSLSLFLVYKFTKIL